MTDSIKTSDQSPTTLIAKPIYRRKRVWLFCLFVLTCAGYSLWLPFVSAFLVYENTSSSPDIIIPFAGRTSIRYAKSYLESKPKLRCFIIVDTPTRVHHLGIIPLPMDQARMELITLGIDPETIQILEPSKEDGHQDHYQRIADQLKIIFSQNKPETKVEIITTSHMTRRLYWNLQDKLDQEILNRTYIRGVPPQDFELNHWWKSRHGIRCVVGEYLLLANFLVDQPNLSKQICTEDEFRKAAIAEHHVHK